MLKMYCINDVLIVYEVIIDIMLCEDIRNFVDDFCFIVINVIINY